MGLNCMINVLIEACEQRLYGLERNRLKHLEKGDECSIHAPKPSQDAPESQDGF
jgi:hypothetical protein